MLCPKCSLPTEVDVQTVIDAALTSDRVDANGVPLPHRRLCVYQHDLWVGVLPLASTRRTHCHEHREPRPCRICAARYAARRAQASRRRAECACGCGRRFATNGRRRFFSDACRQRFTTRKGRRAAGVPAVVLRRAAR
jgi:hypothetical protein